MTLPKLPEPDHFDEHWCLKTFMPETVRAIQEEAYRAGMAAERDRCAVFAKDWLTRGRSPLGMSLASAMREHLSASPEVK
jgi:hypothetical protein